MRPSPLPHPRLLAAPLLALCALQASPVLAQSAYRCQKQGVTVFSDKPCEPDARPVLQPARTLADKPEYWQHLGRSCRQRAETLQRLRNALHAGGETEASMETLSLEQQRYETACGEEDDQARRRLVEDARGEAERERAQRKLDEDLLERCIEGRRVRDLRRARLPSMTAGERADFERFESAFNKRCAGVLPR